MLLKKVNGGLQKVACIGGWLGILVAKNKLRHKIQKVSFMVFYWFTVLFNCSALAGLVLSPNAMIVFEKLNLYGGL